MLDLLLIWGLRGIFGTITQENNKKKRGKIKRLDICSFTCSKEGDEREMGTWFTQLKELHV